MELIQIEVVQINSTTDFYNGQGLENLLLGRKLSHEDCIRGVNNIKDIPFSVDVCSTAKVT